MFTRRNAVKVVMSLPLLASVPVKGRADEQSQHSTSNEFGFVGPADDPEFGPAITGAVSPPMLVGSHKSRHGEVATAFQLLFDVPRGSSAFDAAKYFESITNKNGDGHKYNAEWPTRANPLITGFFSMTNTKPSEGDQTPWCAAFVNFCLYAAGKKTTFSALSGSFRRYGQQTDSPDTGDIVVFSRIGPAGRKGFGHVGLFVAANGEGIKVLGGNQKGDTKTTGAVTESIYPVEGRRLRLHSFRRIQ